MCALGHKTACMCALAHWAALRVIASFKDMQKIRDLLGQLLMFCLVAALWRPRCKLPRPMPSPCPIQSVCSVFVIAMSCLVRNL